MPIRPACSSNRTRRPPRPACDGAEKTRGAGAHDQNIIVRPGARGISQLAGSQIWQETAPRFSRYFWWYSSARQKFCAGTTWVTIGFLKAFRRQPGNRRFSRRFLLGRMEKYHAAILRSPVRTLAVKLSRIMQFKK